MRLSTLFKIRRAHGLLDKVQGVATLFAVSGRWPVLAVVGVGTHIANFAIGLVSRELTEVTASWQRVAVANELHKVIQTELLTCLRHSDNDWRHCVINGQSVLFEASEWGYGNIYAEHDAKRVLAWAREQVWLRHGTRLTLAPVGRWGESVSVRPSQHPPPIDSTAATSIWSRLRPQLAREHRSVLIDGLPRTGKSTVARQVIALAEGYYERSLRVLRISVSDFLLLTPSVVESAVLWLEPEALIIDDIDRFAMSDQLLDLFETIHGVCGLIIATCNDPKKIPVALRMPGRIDEVIKLEGAGDLAETELMWGCQWERLKPAQQAVVRAWPIKLVLELRLRMSTIESIDLAAEIDGLQKRLDEIVGDKPAVATALQGGA